MKFHFLLIVFFYGRVCAQCPWSFTVISSSGNNSLTCLHPTVNLSITHSNSNSVAYLWIGPNINSGTSSVQIVQAGQYSVQLTDQVTNCMLQQTLSVTVNTTNPIFSFLPSITLTANCLQFLPTPTITAVQPSINILHTIYFSVGGSLSSTVQNLTPPLPSGTHTYVLKDLSNGCTSSQTFISISYNLPPSYSISSSSNFLVGCSPLCNLDFVNATSNQTPNAPLSFTVVPASQLNSIPVGVSLNPTPSFSISVPGSYIMIAQDDWNHCRTLQQVSISHSTNSATFSHSIQSGGQVIFQSTSTGTQASSSYTWDFGDGQSSNGAFTSHTYSNGGIHQVRLFASPPNCTSNAVPINVTGIPCTANPNFSLFPSGTPLLWFGVPAYFGNVSQANWIWGDGSSSFGLYPSHTYSASGNYNICLQLTVSCASSASSCSSYSVFKSYNANINGLIEVKIIPENEVNLKEDIVSEDEYLIFPNPSNESMHFINKSDRSIQIFLTDLYNHVYCLKRVESDEVYRIEAQTKGLYFLNIQTQKGNKTKKLIFY